MRPMRRDKLPAGLHTQDEVNKGYAGMVCVVAMGLLKTGPGLTFPVARDKHGTPIALHKGNHFGWQSKLNPSFSATPALSEPIVDNQGVRWIVGYYLPTGTTCFARLDDLQPSKPEHPMNGPAGVDFEIGRGRPRPKAKKRWVLARPANTSTGLCEVTARDLDVRDAIKSTQFAYMLRGDTYKVLVVAPGWRGVEGVDCTDKRLNGLRFWIQGGHGRPALTG